MGQSPRTSDVSGRRTTADGGAMLAIPTTMEIGCETAGSPLNIKEIMWASVACSCKRVSRSNTNPCKMITYFFFVRAYLLIT